MQVHKDFLFSRTIEDYPKIMAQMPQVMDVIVWLRPTKVTKKFYERLRATYWTAALLDEAEGDLESSDSRRSAVLEILASPLLLYHFMAGILMDTELMEHRLDSSLENAANERL